MRIALRSRGRLALRSGRTASAGLRSAACADVRRQARTHTRTDRHMLFAALRGRLVYGGFIRRVRTSRAYVDASLRGFRCTRPGPYVRYICLGMLQRARLAGLKPLHLTPALPVELVSGAMHDNVPRPTPHRDLLSAPLANCHGHLQARARCHRVAT